MQQEILTGDEPANPALDFNQTYEGGGQLELRYKGLTIRQHYAGLCMQGLLAAWSNHDVTGYDELAHDAVKAADELIAAPSKPTPQ